MKFYLGTNNPVWLERIKSPLFISRRQLEKRGRFPIAHCDWALDSGGYSELAMYGQWRITPEFYVEEVKFFQRAIGRLDWVAPMDWMCEIMVRKKTGLTITQHQERTVQNFLYLREELGEIVIPVLQGWWHDDYLRCIEMYAHWGVDLTAERTVGVGSVCRGQGTTETANVFSSLHRLGIKTHGFGVKQDGLRMYKDKIVSADSMAWCIRASHQPPLEGCTHKHCNSCVKYATKWRNTLLYLLGETSACDDILPYTHLSELQRELLSQRQSGSPTG